MKVRYDDVKNINNYEVRYYNAVMIPFIVALILLIPNAILLMNRIDMTFNLIIHIAWFLILVGFAILASFYRDNLEKGYIVILVHLMIVTATISYLMISISSIMLKDDLGLSIELSAGVILLLSTIISVIYIYKKKLLSKSFLERLIENHDISDKSTKIRTLIGSVVGVGTYHVISRLEVDYISVFYAMAICILLAIPLTSLMCCLKELYIYESIE